MIIYKPKKKPVCTLSRVKMGGGGERQEQIWGLHVHQSWYCGLRNW